MKSSRVMLETIGTIMIVRIRMAESWLEPTLCSPSKNGVQPRSVLRIGLERRRRPRGP